MLVVFAVAGFHRGAMAQADWETITSGHQVSVQREYYNVSGLTAEALLSEMQRKGPSGESPSDRFYAITTSQSAFRYESIQQGNECVLTTVGLRTVITVRLPRWDRENDDTDLGRSWRTFVKKLSEHENGHVSISRTGSEEMFLALRALPPARCSVLKQRAQESVQKISDRLQVENDRYDRQTGHGQTQGAVWVVTRGTE